MAVERSARIPRDEPLVPGRPASGSQGAGLAWAFVGVLLFSFSVPLTKKAVGGFDPWPRP